MRTKLHHFIASLIVLLLTSELSLAQGLGKSGELPNMIFADNCNLTVGIYTSKGLTSSTQKSIIGVEGTTYKKIDPKANLEALNENLYNNIVALLDERLKKMGLSPKAYMNMDMVTMASPEKFKAATSSMIKEKSLCLMIISLSDLSQAEKDIKKDNFSLSSLKPAAFTIAPFEGGIEKQYIINRMNSNVSKIMDELEEDIKKKPSEYFIKTVKLEKDPYANVEVNDMDYLIKEGNFIAEYPSDLAQETLLVLDQYSEIKMAGMDKMGKEMFGNFGEKYKYKYEVVGNGGFAAKAKTGKYKYALLMKLGNAYEKEKTTKTKGQAGRPNEYKTTTTQTADAFFMIKDLKTMDIYLGSNEELVATQKPKPQAALKEALKALEKHYGFK